MARVQREHHCIVCGVGFRGRADAKSCSDACRQLLCKKGAPLAGPRVYSPRVKKMFFFQAFTWIG